MQDASKFQKLFISMRYRLLGLSETDKAYLNALRALEYAEKIHTGVRKDGATPEFQHQLEIAHYLCTISGHIIDPANTLAATFLHDVPEDYDISFNDIEQKFGSIVSHSTELLTKKYRGTKKDTAKYFEEISKDKIASLVKGSDRINNHQSMIGVFKEEKIKDYIGETKQYIIPMLKVARREFVEQERAYENIKFLLNSQMSLVEYYLRDKQKS